MSLHLPVLDGCTPIRWDNSLNDGMLLHALCLPDSGGGVRVENLVDPSNGPHGTLTNMEPSDDWQPCDRPGGFACLNFGGTDERVEFGTAIRDLQECSLLVWINPAGTPLQEMIAGLCDNVSSSGVEWSLQFTDLAFAYNDGGIRGWFTGTNTNIAAGVWTHCGIVWRKQDGRVDFYVNGKFIQTVNTTTGTIVYAGDTFDWGHASGNPHFTGKQDDLCIFNRPLLADEVERRYFESCEGYPTCLNWLELVKLAPQAGAAVSRLLNLRRRAIAC